MEELLKSLIFIQQNLNAPKDQFNNFGKFKYRSLEGIEAAIKPLLKEQHCGIRFQDEVVDHCGRTFLKTTLIFFNDKGQSITTTAEAEHSSEKSGMDSAQITGAASSYARKYAMNAMFAIDDTQDADTDAFHDQTSATQSKKAYTRKAQPQAKPQQPSYDRYSGIKRAIDNCHTVDELINLYQMHKNECDGNQEIINLLSARKQQLNTAA